LLGVVSEVAVATWRNGRIDRGIYSDGEGDGGVDVTAPSKWGAGIDRYQVKATRDMGNPERTVSEKELHAADYFVLCCTDAPRSYVEIVGITERETLVEVGKAHGRDGYLLSPRILDHLQGKRFNPKDVRDVIPR
jgi:hypothetical protein